MALGRRVAILVIAAAVLVGLFLVLRGMSEETAAPNTTTAAATKPARTTERPGRTTTGKQPQPPPRPETTVVRIPIRGGTVAGGVKRVTVEKGGRVLIAVSSDDVSDHVHVHGYDLFRDVAPGSPAQIHFRATLAGRFEVELEERGLQVAELVVRP